MQHSNNSQNIQTTTFSLSKVFFYAIYELAQNAQVISFRYHNRIACESYKLRRESSKERIRANYESICRLNIFFPTYTIQSRRGA